MSKYLLANGAMVALLALNDPLALTAATGSSAEEQAFANAEVARTDAIKAEEQDTQGEVLGVIRDERQQNPAYTARVVQKDNHILPETGDRS